MKIIETALKEVGTKESPPDSNNVKYNDWIYGKPVSGPNFPWCGAFVSWVYANSGFPLGNIGVTKGYVGCPYALANIAKWGKVVSRHEVKPGDVVFFDWNHDQRMDHTGIFVKDLGNDLFESIEGNTSLGNDSNGGEVMVRQRRYSVATFVHPNILDVIV